MRFSGNSGTVPKVVAFSENVTVPVGVLPATLIVKVRFTTLSMGDGGMLQVATDIRFDIVCVTTFEVPDALFVSPE